MASSQERTRLSGPVYRAMLGQTADEDVPLVTDSGNSVLYRCEVLGMWLWIDAVQ